MALVLAFQLLGSPEPRILQSAWDALHHLATLSGFLLPFAAFVGGLATSPDRSVRGLVARAAALGLLAYVLQAYVSPVAQYEAQLHRGADTAVRFPMGPEIPSALKAQRDWVENHPPDQFSHSTNAPLEAPPNWLTFLLHTPVAMAAFAIFAALLGWVSALLTSGLSPPARANARWALGVLSGVAFMVTQALAGDWVLGSPSASGVLAAWGPLLLPLLELLLLAGLVRRRRGPLHALDPSGVS
jgi:hypothetical protein